MTFFNAIGVKSRNHKKLVDYFLEHSKQSSLYNKVKSTLKAAILERLKHNNQQKVDNAYIVEYVVSGLLNSYIEWNVQQELSFEQYSLLMTKLCTGAFALLS